MRYFKYNKDGVYVLSESVSPNENFSEITKAEFDVINAPKPPSLEELTESVRHALQEAIDIKAQSFSFSSGNSLILYAGFPSPFQPLAQQFATWEASVWFEADNYKDQVIDGTKPMLSPEQAVAMMPAYPA